MKKKLLLSSILSIVMCFSLICGATFALFTSEDKVNIAVTSGTVKIAAQIKDFEMHSRDVDCTASGIFVNTGTAEIDGNEITLERMTPGDGVSFKIDVQNYSNVTAKYRVLIDVMEDTGLVEALNVSFKDASNNEISLLAGSGFTAWTEIAGADAYATNPDVVNTINVSIEFPYLLESQNEYQGKSCKYQVYVEAVQGNADVSDPFTKLGEREYEINNAQGMSMMDDIANTVSHGEGSWLVFRLTDDIDMTGYEWPTNYTGLNEMAIHFYGNNHTVSNVTINNWKAGFFGYAGMSNLYDITLENFDVTGAQAGIIAGAAEGTLASNVTIAGDNTVTYEAKHQYNDENANYEEWNGIGALFGLSFYTTVENVTIADGATVTIDYNDMITDVGCVYNDNNAGGVFVNNYTGDVTVNGTINKVSSFAYLISNANDIENTFTNGGENVKINSDIVVEDYNSGVKAKATIDFMGNTVSRDSGNGNPLTVYTTEKVTLNNANFESVKGNAVLATRKEGSNIEVNDSVFTNLAAPSTGNTGVQVYASNTTMTFNNCEFNNMPIVTSSSYPENIKLVFNNCKFTWTGDNCPGMIQIANNHEITVDLNNCEFKYETSSQYTTAKNFISFNWPGASTININGLKVTGIRNNDKIWKLVSSNNKVTVNTSGVLSYTFNGQELDFATYLR